MQDPTQGLDTIAAACLCLSAWNSVVSVSLGKEAHIVFWVEMQRECCPHGINLNNQKSHDRDLEPISQGKSRQPLLTAKGPHLPKGETRTFGLDRLDFLQLLCCQQDPGVPGCLVLGGVREETLGEVGLGQHSTCAQQCSDYKHGMHLRLCDGHTLCRRCRHRHRQRPCHMVHATYCTADCEDGCAKHWNNIHTKVWSW